jgi:peptidoglycan/xylan/chitin deacetylase (PgdA/CDA1 family)
MVMPKVAGIAHVILAVEDNGTPTLTSYRRVILKIAPAPALAVPAAKAAEAGARSQVALTFDDLPVHGPVPPGVTRVDIARGILDALKAHHAPPTYGFVNANGMAENPSNADVLKLWREAGHLLGNHTWSHMDLHASTVQAWEQDFLKNEPTLRQYMGDDGWRVLRFPYLHEGDTVEKRAEVARFLKERDYSVARVTMSFDDWAFTDPYARCSVKGDTAALEWLKETYLSRAAASLERAREHSRLAFGREIPQVMLLHAGALGIVMLPRLLDLLEKSGFELVTLQDAQREPAYQTDLGPLPAGGMFLDQVLASKGKTPASAPDSTFAAITGMCK